VSEELPINQLVRIVKDAWVYIKLKEQTNIEGPDHAVAYM